MSLVDILSVIRVHILDSASCCEIKTCAAVASLI